jgi:hypothetical protein
MNFQQLRRIVWTFNVPLGDGEGGFNVMFHCNIVSKVDDTLLKIAVTFSSAEVKPLHELLLANFNTS